MNTPLAPCRTCQQPMSVDANACPRCGAPSGTPTQTKKLVVIGICLATGVFMLWQWGVLRF